MPSKIKGPSWLSRGFNHIWLPYAQMKTTPQPVAVDTNEGSFITLQDGRVLIDGVGSWWTAVHGYRHPALVEAAHRQLDAMPHVMLGGLAHEQAYHLSSRLADVTPGDLSHVFLSESGSVAVEIAMKVAVQYWINAKGESRSKFVAFFGGYHGDTFATMSVCDPEEGMHSLFAGSLMPQPIMALPENEDTFHALDQLLENERDIAAILVEPLIQGAGGMRMFKPDVLQKLRVLADRHNVLLIFDEIFTGFGRTGSLFAAETAAVTPDIMTLGKALTGGITPLAATIVAEKVYQAFHDDDPEKALMHGPTYTGHAIGCAVANASLDLFEQEPRLDQVKRLETIMRTNLGVLTDHPAVADVRVLGAVGVVETKKDFDIDKARAWFIEKGCFIRPLGRVIYLSPAYTIDDTALGMLTQAIIDFVEHETGRQ